MARSMAASRSNRQLSACLTMIASSVVTSFAAPSKSLFANARVLSAAFALFQNFTSSLVKSCWLMSHWNSICIANSRDLVRRDTLLAPRLSGRRCFRMRGAKLARQLRHFDGGEPRFESFVPALESSAVDGLFQRVARQHTKNNRQAAVHLRELQSACGLRTNIVIVHRTSPSPPVFSPPAAIRTLPERASHQHLCCPRPPAPAHPPPPQEAAR